VNDERFVAEVHSQVKQAAAEIIAAAALQPGQVLVVGCSTSEVAGERIGTAGNDAVAEAILEPLWEVTQAKGIYLACQCCEHLNRAIVVQQEAADRYNWEPVSAVPVPQAGGAFASRAMRRMPRAALVEEIQAHAGLDIGSTLIGMHLRRVAIPVRLSLNVIGRARLTAALTRPKLIGGERAVYTVQ
jgi:uncharacterized protein (TIGR01440 family)